jgi:8-oxo-dGTP diphosphatase
MPAFGRRVRAAGGLVTDDEGRVAVVHRPRYDDWSLPKGKLEAGESWEEAALREVEEECGLRCRLGEELPSDSYTDNKGRPKTVRWWRMTPVEDLGFTADDEVDELRWLARDEAMALLSYAHDRSLAGQV